MNRQCTKQFINLLPWNGLIWKLSMRQYFLQRSEQCSLFRYSFSVDKEMIPLKKITFDLPRIRTVSPHQHLRFYSVLAKFHGNSTVFSLSSGHGKCGVAVIRASGPHVQDILKSMTNLTQLPSPRKALLKTLIDPQTKCPIDKGLVIFFPEPASFTGENCLELQVHGGPAVVAALLTALHKVPGCRQADPGEFTKRAFINNKLDLTEVEGLGDLIHAETEAQRRQALRQMDGDLSRLYSRWRKAIIKCVADMEAFIDFSEDQNIEEQVLNQVTQAVEELRLEIKQHVNDNRKGERLREGVHVTIIGEPNVGKSSLLNAVCQRPAAIVTEIAGTTRDVIETAVNIGGYPVLLSDTAGLRETDDVVEKEGVIRALKRAQQADVKILVLDVNIHIWKKLNDLEIDSFVAKQLYSLGITNENLMNQLKGITSSTTHMNISSNRNILNAAADNTVHIEPDLDIDSLSPSDTIIVFNKSDLLTKSELEKLKLNLTVLNSCNLAIMHTYENGLKDVVKHSAEENLKVKGYDDENSPVKSICDDGFKVQETELLAFTYDNRSKPVTCADYRNDKRSKPVTCADSRNDNRSKSFTCADSRNDNRSKLLMSADGKNDKSCKPVTKSHANSYGCVERKDEGHVICCLSCETGEGMEKFLDILEQKVAKMCGNPLTGHPSLTQARHRSHLIKCLDHFEQFDHMTQADDSVLASHALRKALREVGKITGKITSEEILDVIFRDFCIGK